VPRTSVPRIHQRTPARSHHKLIGPSWWLHKPHERCKRLRTFSTRLNDNSFSLCSFRQQLVTDRPYTSTPWTHCTIKKRAHHSPEHPP
ncbi:hypothetical protein M9458_029473, partial [Cirrhinus mrigala]